jgi:transcriptional regulator with XRE-family HTH domain
MDGPVSGAGRSCEGCGNPLSRYNPESRCRACAGPGKKDPPGQPGGNPVSGAELAELRRGRGWTQEMLAERAGVSSAVVKKIEQNAKRSARISTLSALARVLDVPIGVLLGDEPPDVPAGVQARPVHQAGEPGAYRPTLLRALVAERHWQKFKTFEAQFRRAAKDLADREGEPDLAKLTVSARQWERWYSGDVKTEPYPDACRVLEHMFGYPVQQLLASQETSNDQSAEYFAGNYGYGAARSLPDMTLIPPGKAQLMPYLDELHLLSESSFDSAGARERAYDRLVEALSYWADTMKRRELLQVLGWAASAAAAKRLFSGFDASEQMRISQALQAPNRVDGTIIDHIESVLWRLIRQDDALGAQVTLDTVMAQRNVVRLILPECPEHLRPRLLSLFSNYSLQAGWLLYDLTDFEGASYYYEHARATAHQAENTELGALVLCTMSHLATWRGQPRVGIDHAVAAQGWAAQTNEPRLRAYAADVTARAFALDGQRAACVRELGTAEANLNSHHSEPEQSRMYFYTPGQLAGTQSHCLLQLGDVQGAIRAGEESLTLVDPSFVRNLAFTKLFLADAYAAAQEIDQAAGIVGEATVLVAQNRSARLLERLRSTRRVLSPWQQSTAVRELDEQIHAHQLS